MTQSFRSFIYFYAFLLCLNTPGTSQLIHMDLCLGRSGHLGETSLCKIISAYVSILVLLAPEFMGAHASKCIGTCPARLLLLISAHGELAESSVPLLTWVQVDVAPNWKEPLLPLKSVASSQQPGVHCVYIDNKQLRLSRGNIMQSASACTTLKTDCLLQFMRLLLPLSRPCKLPCRTFNRHCSFHVANSREFAQGIIPNHPKSC